MIRWDTMTRWFSSKETPPARAFALMRRGVHHGFALEDGRPAAPERADVTELRNSTEKANLRMTAEADWLLQNIPAPGWRSNIASLTVIWKT